MGRLLARPRTLSPARPRHLLRRASARLAQGHALGPDPPGPRLLAPGSEWHRHRDWFGRTALADLLGGDFGLAEIHKLYATLDQVLPLKEKLFDHLRDRWRDLFGVKYEVLLYDLTSTYFETDTPTDPADPRRHGYSRDHRPDCPQVVIALVVTPEGFPLAYEILPGNTADNTTLAGFLEKIEARHGQAQRVWLMDRGIPTEAVLTQMRASDPPVNYLVGTPKGALTALEKKLLDRPWETVREGVLVKLLPQDGEVYVLARSAGRVDKERAIRRKKLRRLLARRHELRRQRPGRDQRLMALGAAKKEAGRFYALLKITVPATDQAVSAETFSFRWDRPRLRVVRRREGRYLLRSNLTGRTPAELWTSCMQLVQVEEAFKNLKGDLRVRPVHHQKMARIEAHILVAFLAYTLHVCLRQRLKAVAGGLTSRAVLEKFCAVQMVDVHLPTTDGRTVILTRHTQPEKELQVLLEQLHLTLPAQPPPQITAAAALAVKSV